MRYVFDFLERFRITKKFLISIPLVEQGTYVNSLKLVIEQGGSGFDKKKSRVVSARGSGNLTHPCRSST